MSERDDMLKSLLMHAGFHNAQSPYMAQGSLANFRSLLDMARDHQWRSILNVPKDGTFVLVGLASGYVTPMQYCADGYWRIRCDDPDKGWEPQVWQPMPRYK